MSDRIDIANVKITFSNGTIANLTANRYSHESIRTIRVLQPDNYISVDYSKRKFSITKIKKNGKDFDQFSSDSCKENSFPDSDPLSDQIKSFIDSIKNGTEPKVSGVDGRNALSAALSIVDQIEKKYSQLHPKK
jgi:predicted dehydrogenase